MTVVRSNDIPLTWHDYIFKDPDRWQEAIDIIAPVPDTDVVDPVITARRAVAEYVSMQREHLPFVEATLRSAGQSVLRQIVDVSGLPEGWQERYKLIQQALNPELAEAYDFHEEKGIGRVSDGWKTGFIKLLLELDVVEMMEQDWREDAACRGVGPELFFPELDEETEHYPLPTVTTQEKKEAEAAQELYCNNCPVKEQCHEYGYLASARAAGLVVYGEVLNSRSKAFRAEATRQRREAD